MEFKNEASTKKNNPTTTSNNQTASEQSNLSQNMQENLQFLNANIFKGNKLAMDAFLAQPSEF